MGSRPSRGASDRFVPGDWNINCSMCGLKMKAGEAVQNWQGQWRHTRCNEPRHPQDFVHAINAPEMVVPFVQKDADNDIVTPPFPLSSVVVVNTFGVPVNIYIYPQGANFTTLLVNGISVPVGTSPVLLEPGGTIEIIYTGGFPMWFWAPEIPAPGVARPLITESGQVLETESGQPILTEGLP